MKIDELNINPRSRPYDEYFGSMELTEKQKRQRMGFAQKTEDMLLFLFALFLVYVQYEHGTDYEYVIGSGLKAYSEVIKESVEEFYSDTDLTESERKEINEYLEEYAREFVTTNVETTNKHINDSYYFSEDRAIFIAENEANTVLNYLDYDKAVKTGKTRKTWIDVRDNRERETHLKVGGKTIGISDAFLVGNSLMMFPKDTSLGATPEEIVNCRCTIKYF